MVNFNEHIYEYVLTWGSKLFCGKVLQVLRRKKNIEDFIFVILCFVAFCSFIIEKNVDKIS